MLTETISGPHTENLKHRLQAYLDGRVSHWEGTAIDRTPQRRKSEMSRKTKPTPTARESTDPVKAERTRLLQAYRDEGWKSGLRITDKMVAEAARPTWHDRTPVQRWKRNDPRSNSGDDVAIRRVLRVQPHLK
jgi:hypothetical protein